MAIKAGMTYKEAMHSTPKVISMYINAYKEKKEEENEILKYLPWQIGAYVCSAISSCFGKNNEYPKQPFGSEEKTDNPDIEEEVLTEEEKKQKEVEKLFLYMQIKQANFELNNNLEGDSD